MHNAAFEKLGMDAVYFRMLAGSAKEAMRVAKEIGLAGMNITAPFKEEMLALVDELEESAKAVGAVNTVKFGKGGKILGFNTDALGVSEALKANGIEMNRRKFLVLGAGGAAKAAVHALVSNGASVTVANRTLEKARAVANGFGCGACSLGKNELAEAIGKARVVVSTLSTKGMVVPRELLRRELVVLDAVYGSETAISSDAAESRCKLISGREWLLFQGVKAFEIMAGKKAPVEAMRKAVANAGGRSMKQNIALVGFMGSGKTATAKEIAKLNSMKLVEIDEGIAAAAGMEIGEIFRKHGEGHFRKLESEAIASLSRAKDCVVSCGGGAVLDGRNAAILRKNCVVVWLWATPEEIMKRIGKDASRPLMDRKDKLHAARGILAERMKLYASACDFAISTEGRSAEEAARLILEEIDAADAKARG
jgi:shikimate dehydrogenase